MVGNTEKESAQDFEMAADLLGDRWSLLILRNLSLRRSHSFNELLGSVEGIATNILASRLRKLLSQKVITVSRDSSDHRRLNYGLTRKGKGLAPVLDEMTLWTARYTTGARRKGMHESVQQRKNGPNEKRFRGRDHARRERTG
jgi:DNA-binding HxlR family transcriptional regulator